MFGKKKNLRIEDAMIRQMGDRRLLSHVPDPSGQRRNNDRRDNRENDESRPQYARYAGRRFLISTDVLLHYAKEGQEKRTGVIRGVFLFGGPSSARTEGGSLCLGRL